MEEEDPMSAPYHYGCHYSNSGTVLHFLVRMPPFTKMFLQYQGKSNKNGNRTLEWNRLVLSLIHQFRYRHSISFPILIPVPTPFPFWFLFVPFLSSSLQNYSMFWRFHCFVCVYLYITLMEITLFFGRSKFWYSWSYISLYGNNVAFIVIWICNWCQRAHSRVLFPPRVPWEPRRYGVRVNDWGLKMKSLLL